jgi:hypothetical protein
MSAFFPFTLVAFCMGGCENLFSQSLNFMIPILNCVAEFDLQLTPY